MIGGSALPSAAQTTTCPPHALLSIARAGAACVNLDAGMACYGSGSVSSTPAEGSSAALVQLGDRVLLRDLASISVSPDQTDAETVSFAALAIHISPRASDLVNVLLINDAELSNEVAPPVELTLQAVGALHVRTAPASDADVIDDLAVNDSVIANGRSGDWLRVIIPATGAVGWASASSLQTSDISRLPEVEPSVEVAQPFQIVEINSNGNSACGDLLPAGMLLQTPSTEFADAVPLTINGVNVRLAGVVFISSEGDRLTVIALNGVVELGINGTVQVVPAGGQASSASGTLSGATPYDASVTAALPINNLPRRFQVTPPQTQNALDARIAALTAPTSTPVPVEPTPANVCRRIAAHRSTIWSGPGEDYEALTQIDAGTSIHPVLATTNPRGEVWWQLADSGWLARSDVSERGDCSGQTVPTVERVPAPPTNTYSMERCASNNGPVRAGQRVTFEFIPPAWDNLGEARAATRTDPGHFELNGRYYRATSSDPFRLGENVDPLEDRYLRRFTLVWTADPGTYRITGDWLSYEPSCNLTVPVE